jgi:hypothetical protein
MTNPWTKTNPFMSMWLSGANAAAGQARSQLQTALINQQAAVTKNAARFWTDAWLSALKQPRR